MRSSCLSMDLSSLGVCWSSWHQICSASNPSTNIFSRPCLFLVLGSTARPSVAFQSPATAVRATPQNSSLLTASRPTKSPGPASKIRASAGVSKSRVMAARSRTYPEVSAASSLRCSFSSAWASLCLRLTTSSKMYSRSAEVTPRAWPAAGPAGDPGLGRTGRGFLPLATGFLLGAGASEDPEDLPEAILSSLALRLASPRLEPKAPRRLRLIGGDLAAAFACALFVALGLTASPPPSLAKLEARRPRSRSRFST
mmetsp:Transcript_568/g.2257  ORF Transcript_568/g.2257 Transcript_568/m.2257 type:complete len:255 (-) Transcript_568:587-1351(-)